MSGVQLKVCCIASVAEAELALAHGADAIGLVSAMPSGPGLIPAADIAAHVREVGTDTVQIVDTPAADVLAERGRSLEGIALVPVIHVRGPDAIAQAQAQWPRRCVPFDRLAWTFARACVQADDWTPRSWRRSSRRCARRCRPDAACYG